MQFLSHDVPQRLTAEMFFVCCVETFWMKPVETGLLRLVETRLVRKSAYLRHAYLRHLGNSVS
jgi:hypothetical protein